MIRKITVGLTLGLIAGSASAADIVDGPRLHWNYAGWGKPRASSAAYMGLAEFLEERTGGKFTMQIHWGTLSKPRAVLDGLSLGAFEAGSYCASYYPAKIPASAGIELPFLPIVTPDQQAKVADAYAGLDVVQNDFKKWNAINYHNSILPPYEVLGKGEPPKSLDDWAGLRIRSPGPSGMALAKLGAVPTSVPAPDVYTSMDRSLIDAAGFAMYSHLSYRTYELGNWYTHGLKYVTLNCGLALSIPAVEALPPQYKTLLEEYKDYGYKKQIEAFFVSENKEGPETFDKAGLTRIEISDEEHDKFAEAAGRPVWDDWIAKITEEGYDGKMLVDFILASAKKYRNFKYE